MTVPAQIDDCSVAAGERPERASDRTFGLDGSIGPVDAGCTATTPDCGACAGIHRGPLVEDEVCVATSRRNFIGRLGNRDAKIDLGSPLSVAASALEDRLADPGEH